MHLLIFGLGYVGTAIARAAAADGATVTATVRQPAAEAPPGVRLVPFGSAGEAILACTHAVSTAPPDPQTGADPVLPRWRAPLEAAPRLAWLGYISTTGVYGDHGGGWVDEHTPPRPSQERSVRRLAAEAAWTALAADRPVDVFRTAGIYGPGRSALDDLRAGRARRPIKPGHVFGRIHRDDIAGAVLAAARQARPPGTRPPGARVLHLSDDEPAESAAVVEEAARLLGVAPPPALPFDASGASAMARSFWAEHRRVDSRLTQAWLRRRWTYPTYREGLRAILAEQAAHGRA